MNFTATKEILLKIIRLFIAFTIIAFGTEMMIQANIGMNPWGTLTLGLMHRTGLAYGTLTQMIGLLLLMLLMVFRVYPGIATIMDMALIGVLVNGFHHFGIIPQVDFFIIQVMMCIVGLIIFCYGLYILQ